MDEKIDKIVEEKAMAIKFEKDKSNEITKIPNSPSEARKLVQQGHTEAIKYIVNTDDNVKNDFLRQGRNTIKKELKITDDKITKDTQVAAYNAAEEACNNYGIQKDVPLWQIRIMKIGSSFWFVIYYIFATVTIAPLNIFCKGLKAFIKNSYVVFIFALIMYLIIVVGIPLLIRYFNL